MGQKKKKKVRKQGHPARQEHRGKPANSAIMERQVDSLAADYVAWFESAYDDPEMGELALPSFELVRYSLGVYAETTGALSATELRVEQLIEVLAAIVAFAEDQAQDDLSMQQGQMLLRSWQDYALFLDETGRWAGTEQQLQRLLEFAEGEDDSRFADMEDEGLFEHMRSVITGELRQAPLLAIGRRLSSWLGTGRPVQENGELTPEAFAEAQRQMADLMPDSRTFDVPAQLLRIYRSLLVSGVCDLRRHDVLAGEAAEDFAQEIDSEAGFAAVFNFVQAYVEDLLELAPAANSEMTGAWELCTGWIFEGLDGAALPVGQDTDPTVRQEQRDLAVGMLEELAWLGLIAKDEGYHSTVSLSLMVESFIDSSVEEDPFDDSPETSPVPAGRQDGREQENVTELEAIPGTGAETAGKETPGTELAEVLALPGARKPDTDQPQQPADGTVLQLKVTLRSAKPPIWRRVLVRPETRLDELHAIIQRSFAWDDSHLHSFSHGGRNGASYAPKPGGMDEDIDETTVTVGELLSEPKDKLDYIYDFGDNWEHVIELEKVLDDDGGTVPRCTGGRRMAPAEDSGGVWGWENIQAAVEDRKHPEHDEYRQWLGLGEGEALDVAHFDKDEVNQRLSRLR
ncbi:plasmid pRiA4b ORF-3 family protein [Glutamicibacter sp. V16R2B1]|uniref:plasmid pRiA4b ORF-3 family protein n=2 Tax=Micrococcaceae TaxID=1268 RepID=UPI0010FE87FF|nr:plasmid pRiA4b ORF-3 family protein [Glutamicibacter sp. V16R2B1]TLK51936.1 plasmid pRiA4b ORF-3 family protein [Glutamicibacter sp. V16R2B1]